MMYKSLSELFKDVILGLIYIGLLISGFCLYFNEKADNQRLTNNLNVINQPAETFTTRDGHQASKKMVQYITPDELKEIFPEVKTNLSNLYIKPNRTENYTETRQTLNIDIKAPVRIQPIEPIPFHNLVNNDTLRQNPSNLAEARVIEFYDEWINIKAELGTDTGNIQVAAVDTIFTAIYRGARRRPLLWILSKRQLEVAASNRNPYITIEVIQSGLIKK